MKYKTRQKWLEERHRKMQDQCQYKVQGSGVGKGRSLVRFIMEFQLSQHF